MVLVIVLVGFYFYFFTGVFDFLSLQVQLLFGKKVTSEEYLINLNQEDWDYNTQIVSGEILDFDPKAETIRLAFISPLKLVEKIRTKNPIKTVKITCPVDQRSYYVDRINAKDTTGSSNETELVGKNVDLFKIMNSGDIFFGFCSDSDCNEISKYCELHQAIID